jgi:hypothetical protein
MVECVLGINICGKSVCLIMFNSDDDLMMSAVDAIEGA